MAGRFSLEALFKARDAFTRPIAKMQDRFSRFTRSATRSVAELNKMTDKIAGGLARAGAAAAAGAVASGAAVFSIGKTGADFEQAIADVGAVSLMTRKEIASLEKKALELGASTKFSATEVANGMELMGRAGFDNEQILAGISGVLAAAAAEGAELADVAGIVSNVMKGMGLKMTETNRVADVLALASARTNSSISSLGESMANVSATARQFNVPFEDTVAAVALLQDVGLDASEAGTAVATMLTKLATPSKEAAQQMAALGVKFQDAKGNMLPLMDVFGQFQKAAQKAGGNMKTAAFFADLVGLRGQKAAINLKDLFTSGKVGDLTKELQTASGSAEKMAKLRMDTLKGDLEQLGGAVDTFKIGLFNLQSGPLRGVVQGMTEWLDKNSELIIQDVGGFIKTIQDNAGKFVEVAERVGRAVVPILAVAVAIKAIAAATWLWNAALAANPLTLWIIGITAALALLFAFWPEVSAFFGRLFAGMKDLAGRIGAAVSGVISGVWQPVKSFLVGVAEFVVGLLTIMFFPLGTMLGHVFDLIRMAAGLVMAAWAPLAEFFAGLWNGIVGAVMGAANRIAGVATAIVARVKAIWAPIAEFFSGLWQSIADTFKAIVGGVVDKISGAVDFVRGIGARVLGTDGPGAGEAAADTAGPILPNGDATLREIRESSTTSRGEVTIRDKTGRAEITKPAKGPGFALNLEPSGAF